jgi:uncharacterized ParB-like nuclease family protein
VENGKIKAWLIGLMGLSVLQTTYLVTTGERSQATRSVTSACASEGEAKALLGGLFPDSEILKTREATFGEDATTCLLEVEMQVVGGQPATQGYVYVLPGATTFLNGPLLDATSKLTMPEQAAATDNLSVETASDSTKAARDLALLNEMAALLKKVTAETPASPTPKSNRLIDRTLLSFETAPNQVVFYQNNPHPVYVAFDPLCSKCHRLYAQQNELAERYGARIVWIPTYLNEESRAAAAHVVKALAYGNEAAGIVVDDLMNGGWSAAEYEQRYGALTDHDYRRLEESAKPILDLMVQHRLGTPLVLFSHGEGPDSTTMFNGYAPVSDFHPLLNLQ